LPIGDRFCANDLVDWAAVGVIDVSTYQMGLVVLTAYSVVTATPAQ
jgi:hypothetical protein